MATTWTAWDGVGSNYRRIGFEVELVSQNQSGNSSTVRWRLVVEGKASTLRSFNYWGTGVGGNGENEVELKNGIVALTSWVTRSVAHASNGAGTFTTWVEKHDSTHARLGSRVTVTLALPSINRLPSAPGAPSISTTHSLISAVSPVAGTNGGAAVTAYGLEYSVSGATGSMAVSDRTGTTTTADRFGLVVRARARAQSVAGWGAWGAWADFQMPEASAYVPLAPVGISAVFSVPSIVGALGSFTSAVAGVQNGAPVTGYELSSRVESGAYSSMPTSGQVGVRPLPGVFGVVLLVRARARSNAGWGEWSADVPILTPAVLGVRADEAGNDVGCQVAERYVGAGVWVPCTEVERFDGAAWVRPM